VFHGHTVNIMLPDLMSVALKLLKCCAAHWYNIYVSFILHKSSKTNTKKKKKKVNDLQFKAKLLRR